MVIFLFFNLSFSPYCKNLQEVFHCVAAYKANLYVYFLLKHQASFVAPFFLNIELHGLEFGVLCPIFVLLVCWGPSFSCPFCHLPHLIFSRYCSSAKGLLGELAGKVWQMHLFIFTQVPTVRKVKVFPLHLMFAHRSCDQQAERRQQFCECMHMLSHKHVQSSV